MKLRSAVLGMVILLVIFGSVSLADALGCWQTENSGQPAKFASGAYAGEFNPADIRGSYTFADIEQSFQVDTRILAQAFGLSAANAEDFQLKSLETLYASQAAAGTEIGTNSVKYFVSLYTGLPFELTETVYLPQPAVAILTASGKLSAEAAAGLVAITVELSNDGSTLSAVDGSIQKETVNAAGVVIKGSTTFREVLDAGVNQKEVETVIGKALPNPLIVIKTYCTEEQLDFEAVKTALQALLDAK
ncbi:MAG: hypothetical protein LLG09_03065 [Negativicutes bacterium]|nr:hypothetical protein [Negativicutes bacterium]